MRARVEKRSILGWNKSSRESKNITKLLVIVIPFYDKGGFIIQTI